MDVLLLTGQQHFGAWLYNDHLVTCDLNTRHIGIHNPSAAVLWMLLDGAVTLELLSQDYAEVFSISAEQAQQDIQTCLTAWQAQSWVCQNTSGRWLIEPVIGDAKVSSFDNASIATSAFNAPTNLSAAVSVHRETYCFGDKPFELHIKATAPLKKNSFALNFCERLIAVCSGFSKLSVENNSSDPSKPFGMAWVTLTFDNQNIAIEDSIEPGARSVSTELAMGYVYEAFIKVSYPQRNVILTLHAAGVKKNNDCLSLAGVSGVGKSTLSAFLAHSGWHLLGDDIVAIELHEKDQPSLGLLPFPTAVGLKAGSWPALTPLYPELDHLPTFPYGEKLAKYLAIKRKLNDLTPSFWNAIVLPRHTLRSESQERQAVKVLSPAEGLQGLLTAGMSLFGNPTVATIDKALSALIKLPCFSIEYSDFDEAQACLKDLKTG
jgi:hypothetical protein